MLCDFKFVTCWECMCNIVLSRNKLLSLFFGQSEGPCRIVGSMICVPQLWSLAYKYEGLFLLCHNKFEVVLKLERAFKGDFVLVRFFPWRSSFSSNVLECSCLMFFVIFTFLLKFLYLILRSLHALETFLCVGDNFLI